MKDTTTYLFEQILAGRVDRNIGVELLTRLKREHTLQTAEMAVIGMSVRLPHARTPDQFWQNLRAGIDSIGPLPPRRRQDEDRYLEALGKLSHDYELGAYLEEIDAFDYRFFRLTPKEASLMSPAQRLFLESAWETIEEAGYGGNQLRGSKTGVYIGYGSDALHDYMQMIQTVEPNAVSMAVPGNLSPIVASRIAYLLDLRGPSMAIDTTCSSSLVALHVACQAIRNGDCEQALVGGIRINYLRQKGELRMGIQASDGRAKTFDDSSDGTGSGEGVVAVLIKPLDKALHDGDQIHAVIKGSAINQDGNSIGLTAPNVLAQEQLLLDAWQAAGVSPETITYLEAHGTGTKLGDPIEIDALRKAFRRHTARTQFCGIGSVKTNVGHLDNAAGLVGLIKTILALKHGELPPSLHFMKANRQIRFEDSPVYVVDRLMPWATDGIPRRAGISSFGLSGTNCHVVLEEAPKRAKTRKEEEKIWLLPLSAKTKSGLAALKEQYRHRLMSGEHLSLPDLCQTAALGRGQYEHRMAILASSRADLLAKLSGGEGVYSSSALMLQKSDTEGPDVDGWLARWIMERQGEAREQLLVELGILYVQGADIPWNLVYQDEVWNKASLPVYPFERTRCWIDIPINLSKKEQGIAMSQAYESAAIKHGETVLAFVKQTVQDITGISEAEISAEHNLFEMGLDSLMLVQVSERIKDHYGLEIPLGEFYEELSTPGALAAYLTEHLPAQSPDALVDYQASVVSVHNTPVQQVLSNPVAPDVTQAARNLPPAGGSDLERLLAQQLQVMSMQLELLSKPSQDMTKAQTAFLQTAATATASPVQQIRDEGDTGSTEPDQGVFIPYRKLALTPSTMSEQQLRHVEELAARLSERFKLTKEMTQKFRRVLANNRNVAGFKPAWKEMIVQVIAERAQGSKIWDVDGREYLDISMGFGVHLLGHAPSFITEAVREEALRGMPLGPMNPLAGEVAQLISEFTGMERIAFFNSGTEAVMVALRLARAVTGRSKIALFEGSFHGTFDGVLARRHSAGGVQAVPVAPGITDHLVGDVVVLKYNDPESLEIIKRHAHELAGVLVEPVQSRRPDLQPREFLQELRQVTKERDIALIFDEIITGFRIHPGGAQAWFGVQADIATYGKIMGGGLPVGVVAGKSKYMNSIDGGDWQYGDDSYPQSDRTRTLVGGTFCHHPLAMAAIRAMLDHLRAEGAVVQERINVRTTRLVTTLNEYFEQTEVPIKMVHFGSLFRFVLSGDLELLFYHLLDNGIYVWEGRNCFLSSAHTDGDVDRLINAVINSVEAMREGGFLPKLTQAKERDASSIERIPFTEGQRNLWLHTQIGHQESMAYNEYVILDLDGPLHTKALRGAVQKIVQRHEILRATRVDEHGFLLEASPAIDIQVVDFTAFTEAEQADRLRDWLESKAQHPIDLESLLMFRLYLLKQGPTRHQLVIILPHLMADGWSTAVLLGELEAIYREGCTHIPVSLPEPVQFREYVEWLAERQGGSEGEEMVLYWREQFAEPIPPLDLPLDLPRPVQRSFSGARLRIKVGAPLLESLKKFSRHQGCSLFHTLFGVFQLFLYRLTGQNRFVIGIPTAGQVDMPKNYLVGQCANVLPFVCQVEGGDAFAHLLQKVKHDSASAMKNQHVAVSSLAKGTTIPDVQVMFNLDRQVGKPQLYGIKTDMVAYPIQYVKYELTLNAVEVDGDMLLDFDYKTELFYSESVQRWTAQFLSLLEQIVASPGVLHDEFELDGEPPQFLSESRKGKDGGDLALANALNISQEDRLTLADSLLPTDRESLIRIARAAGAEEGPADVSTVYAVPVSALQDGALYLPSHAIRWLAIGNERLSGSDINSFRERLAPGSSVTVLYRPDELAQFVAVHEVGDALLHPLETVPFGRALPGVSLVALQHTGRPAPLGVYGDLYAILPGQGEELRSLGIRGRRLTADLFGRELQCQERQLLGGKAVSDTERRLLTFWQEVLGIPDIGVHDHFFELGGQSFKAAQIIGRIREEWGNDLSLLTIFEHPTVFKLARFIDRSTARERPPIMPIRSKERYVASSAQKRQYILNQLDPSSTAYHLTAAFRLSGHLDRNALEYALQQVVHRHESLRTSFHFDDGECWQIVHDDISLRLEEGDGEEGDIHRMANSFLRPFDLGTAPLMRARLVTVGDETHVLFLDLHHIIADGLSVNILFRDLLSSWKGRALQPLELQSKDFAEWQQTLLESEFGQEQEAYWLSQFAGELPLLKLPTDFPRPANKSYEGACHAFSFDSQLSKALQELALKTDSTLFMVLLAAFQVLLAKFTMQEDIIVGSPVAGRPTAQTEGVIGMFVNTVPLRGRPHAARTFRDFLQEVKGTCLDAFDNQEYPLERLVERLGLPRDTSRNPLFDTLFVFDNMGSVQAELHDLKIEPVKLDGRTAQFDLALHTYEEGSELRFTLEYATKLFQTSTAERIARHFTQVVRSLTAQPDKALGELQMIDEKETNLILNQFNSTAVAYDQEETVHGLFEKMARAYPDAPAAIFDTQTLCYGELNEKAGQLARVLRTKGVGPDQPVGIMTDRSPEMIIGILAILKAGGAYLPIDPGYPKERIAYLLQDSQARLLLVKGALVDLAFAGETLDLEDECWYQGESILGVTSGPRHLAYVIYTSGSTGQPKGVMIEHHAVINRLQWMQKRYPLTEQDVILQKTPFSFDVSVWELFWWGMTGASAAFLGPGEEKNPQAIVEAVERWGVTVMHFVPSMLHLFLEAVESTESEKQLSSLRRVFISGEALQVPQAHRCKRLLSQTELVNLYGPTEATVDVSFHDCTGDADLMSVPIGKPIDNIELYVIDEQQHLQPIGVPGELCIAGAGLARGYWNRPELTREKFVDNPFRPGTKMYKTGDLARWLPNGEIEYLGRLDHQVKVRGYRIELGEIEAALVKVAGIQEAVVAAREVEAGIKDLCAYYTKQGDLTAGEIRQALTERMPGYMVPGYFVELAEMPLTPNGKLDRKRLPDPRGHLQRENEYAAPRTQVEERVIAVWENVLGVKPIGVDDSFLHLGGDSIKAIQVVSQLMREGLCLQVKDLFSNPTVRSVAPFVTKASRTIVQGPVEGELVLAPVQRWFFENIRVEKHHFNQSLLLHSLEELDDQRLKAVLGELVAHHDALRLVFREEEGLITANHRGLDETLFDFESHDLLDLNSEALKTQIENVANRMQNSIDLAAGPMVKVARFRTSNGDHLLLIFHHLIVDGVSWRILLEDFVTGWEQASRGEAIRFPAKTDSYQTWNQALQEHAMRANDLPYWQSVAATVIRPLPADRKVSVRKNARSRTLTANFSADQTAALLKDVHGVYQTEINDLLLTALAIAVREWSGHESMVVQLEGHGREDALVGLSVHRTVGWFTSMYPVVLPAVNDEHEYISRMIKEVKETLRRIPHKGIGYGILRAYRGNELQEIRPEISFNYLGQWGDLQEMTSSFSKSTMSPGEAVSPQGEQLFKLDINGGVSDGCLRLDFQYCADEYDDQTIAKLVALYERSLQLLITHCQSKDSVEFTPSDFSAKGLDLEDLEDVFDLIDKNF